MNKQEFLSILKSALGSMPQEEKQEILYDYEEHFTIGLEEGKTEDEIILSLGDPKSIAKEFKASYTFKKAEENTSTKNVFSAVLAAMGMGFFNLVLVLGPFLAIASVVLAFFITAFALALAGAATTICTLFAPVMPNLINVDMNYVFAISISIGITALGLLSFIGMCYVGKGFLKITVRYLKWNMEIIKK